MGFRKYFLLLVDKPKRKYTPAGDLVTSGLKVFILLVNIFHRTKDLLVPYFSIQKQKITNKPIYKLH